MRNRVKEICKEKGIKQIDLANKLGINKVSLYRLLSENNDLRISTLEKIATALNVPLWSLLVSKEEITKEDKNTLLCPKCGTRFKLVEVSEDTEQL